MFSQIYEIGYFPKYTLLKQKISTIQGRLAHEAGWTVDWSYWSDLHCGIELQIHVKELLFDNANRSKVMDDKTSSFTRMEVRDLIYYQFCYTATSLGRQGKTSQYFEPLGPWTLAVAVAAIHCVLSEYGSGKKTTVRFLKMNIEVQFAHPLWLILLQKPLYSSMKH